MSAVTGIEWTDRTWNPIVGCSEVSPGCAHCYAAVMAHRLEAMALADIAAGRDPGRKRHYIGTTTRRGREKRITWTGKVNVVPEALDDPFRWRKPSRVFVNSMSDLFHPRVPRRVVDQVFAAIADTPHHTYQVLTKHPLRASEYARSVAGETRFPLDNLHLGVSVEDQQRLFRVGTLVRFCWPLAGRLFASCEPLLSALDLRPFLEHLGWVIVGGESGTYARPMHPDWPRVIRDHCLSAGVPFFFKQWGEWGPCRARRECTAHVVYHDGRHVRCDQESILAEERRSGRPHKCYRPVAMFRVGKKAAGRLLDGLEWSQFPECQEVVA